MKQLKQMKHWKLKQMIQVSHVMNTIDCVYETRANILMKGTMLRCRKSFSALFRLVRMRRRVTKMDLLVRVSSNSSMMMMMMSREERGQTVRPQLWVTERKCRVTPAAASFWKSCVTVPWRHGQDRCSSCLGPPLKLVLYFNVVTQVTALYSHH